MDPEFSRRDMLDNNPMVWLLQVNGLLVDARQPPEALQVQAWRRGLIPWVPARSTGDPGRQIDHGSMMNGVDALSAAHAGLRTAVAISEPTNTTTIRYTGPMLKSLGGLAGGAGRTFFSRAGGPCVPAGVHAARAT